MTADREPQTAAGRTLATPDPHDACERDMLALIDQRDRAEDAADQLAYAIAPMDVIGEHSSGNDPWANALEFAAGGYEDSADAAREAHVGLREALENESRDENLSPDFRKGVAFAAGYVGLWFDAPEDDHVKRRFRSAAREAQPDPRVEALIAALTNAGRDLHWYHTGDVAFEACGSFTCTAIGHALENAKRRAPAAPPTGIDVERLRQAVENLALRTHPNMDRGGGIAYSTAGAVAETMTDMSELEAEYARLATQPTADPEP